jgi:diguanylate cyclase (GGDEF)-like protein
MELYALNDEVERQETALATLTGVDRAPILVTLAWHLRQRDAQRAAMLADEAGRLLDNLPSDARTRSYRARLDLVQAGIDVLHRRFDAAKAGLARADAAFTALGDPVGLSDSALVVHLLNLSCNVALGTHESAEETRAHYTRGATLLALGRIEEALDRIEAARILARTHRIEAAEIEIVRTLAQIHRRHALPPPRGMREPTAVVHYLEQALTIGRAIEGWQAPVDLLMDLSAAWEAGGYNVRALDYLKQAVAAERRQGDHPTGDRMPGLQKRTGTPDTAGLARAEAQRIAALEATLLELRGAQTELEMRRTEFERLSLLDPLTGIGNRRHFDDRAAAETARARRQTAPLGVAMFDIDHLKRVNDRFGHAAGDAVLRRVAEVTRGMLRPSDFIARLDGDEFILLLPGAELHGLRRLAERVRERIAAVAIERDDAPERIAVTASFGIATLDPDDAAIEPVVARADAALHRAKRDGRNRSSPMIAAVASGLQAKPRWSGRPIF